MDNTPGLGLAMSLSSGQDAKDRVDKLEKEMKTVTDILTSLITNQETIPALQADLAENQKHIKLLLGITQDYHKSFQAVLRFMKKTEARLETLEHMPK